MNFSNVKKILTGTVLGLVLSCLMIFLCAVLLYVTSVPESSEDIFVLASAVCGLIFAGIVSSRKSELHGWLRGGLSGIVYIIILSIISAFVSGIPSLLRIGISLVVGFVTGAVGGIVGINMKSKKRR